MGKGVNVAILGGGPAGLAAALRLLERGHRPTIYEATSSLGGLSKSFELWGRRVELSSHIFAPGRPQVDKIWNDAIQGDFRELSLRRALVRDTTIFDYPLTVGSLLRGLGWREFSLCVASRLDFRRRDHGNSAEAWGTRRYGSRLYRLFLADYIEKLWGCPGSEIHESFLSALAGGTNDKVKRRRFLGAIAQALPSPRKAFPYPRHGIGAVWAGMEKRIREQNGEIRLNAAVDGVSLKDGKVASITTADGTHACDFVISTLPKHVVRHLLGEKGASPTPLAARSTILVFLEIMGRSHLPYLWLYVNSRHNKIGRITNYSAWWETQNEADSFVLCLEYWCNTDDEMWTATDDQMAEAAKSDLLDLPIWKDSKIRGVHVIRAQGTHPRMPLTMNEPDVAGSDLDVINLKHAGRHGSGRLLDMSESMQSGLDAADEISSDFQTGEISKGGSHIG